MQKINVKVVSSAENPRLSKVLSSAMHALPTARKVCLFIVVDLTGPFNFIFHSPLPPKGDLSFLSSLFHQPTLVLVVCVVWCGVVWLSLIHI